MNTQGFLSCHTCCGLSPFTIFVRSIRDLFLPFSKRMQVCKSLPYLYKSNGFTNLILHNLHITIVIPYLGRSLSTPLWCAKSIYIQIIITIFNDSTYIQISVPTFKYFKNCTDLQMNRR